MLMNEKIKQLRKNHGFTQWNLADYIGASHSEISWWESGRFEPSVHQLIKLADFFNVTLDELCCRNFKGGK